MQRIKQFKEWAWESFCLGMIRRKRSIVLEQHLGYIYRLNRMGEAISEAFDLSNKIVKSIHDSHTWKLWIKSSTRQIQRDSFRLMYRLYRESSDTNCTIREICGKLHHVKPYEVLDIFAVEFRDEIWYLKELNESDNPCEKSQLYTRVSAHMKDKR